MTDVSKLIGYIHYEADQCADLAGAVTDEVFQLWDVEDELTEQEIESLRELQASIHECFMYLDKDWNRLLKILESHCEFYKK